MAEVPRVTLVGVREQVSPLGGETAAERDTVPVKPETLVTVIVDVPALPALTVTLVGLAVTVKSWTVKTIVAVLERDPLVPVTVTVYVPAEPLHDSVEVPEVPRVTLVGDRAHVRPVDGEMAAARVTVPVKPLTLVRVMVEVPAAPALTVTLVGLAAIVKPWTMRVTVAVLDWEPAVPVIVIVDVPRGAVELVVKVRVDVAEPSAGGVTGLGLKLAVTPLGRPVADSVTGELKPPEEEIVMVVETELPGMTVREDGLAVMVKPACETVRERLIVRAVVLLAPVTVTVKEPTAAV